MLIAYNPPYDSEIEDIFAWNFIKYCTKKINFLPQYEVQTTISMFRLDFVIELDGIKVGIECDGRDFHDEWRDEWRDAIILGGSDIEAIFRFTGTDIFKCIEVCIYVISVAYPQFFSKKGRDNLEQLYCASSIDGTYDEHLRRNIVDCFDCINFSINDHTRDLVFYDSNGNTVPARHHVKIIYESKKYPQHWNYLLEFAQREKHIKTLDELIAVYTQQT